ncbi:hypothetical protein SO802_004037 [Lithocarpus litseifolius]|uniref:Reverse transcriptase zinc-binding domain-containing protein n=1 Tax=Lithocarpus litseifolius TaxID=425828 RepID=A0AAW2E1W7_9ROSI
MIQAIPVTIMSRGTDKLTWAGSPQGTFDLKSAYRLAMGLDTISPFSASWIWKAETLPKIKTFPWRCAHNSIGVKVCLERTGITQEIMCPIYQGGSETIFHALRDCHQLKCMWNQLGISSSKHEFWRNDLQSWLSLNGWIMSSLCATQPPWKVVFPIAIWNVWKSRNNVVINRKNRNLSLDMEIVKLLASRIPQIHIKHCFRQANRCANSLARMSFSIDVDFSSFDSPPVDLVDVFEDDLNGVCFNRICPELDVLL